MVSVSTWDKGVIKGLNFLGDVVGSSSGIIPVAIAGALSARVFQYPPIIGAFQGAAVRSFAIVVADPISSYVGRHSGLGEDKIHGKAQAVIYTALIGATILVPTALTTYYAPDILNGVASHLPSLVGRFVTVDPDIQLEGCWVAANIIAPLAIEGVLRVCRLLS